MRFNLEADSLNCSILSPDVTPDIPEYNLFVKEVVNEMTIKAGQKCTAIRRTIVPIEFKENVINSIKERLRKIKIGVPGNEGVRMGSLADNRYVEIVNDKIAQLKKQCQLFTKAIQFSNRARL